MGTRIIELNGLFITANIDEIVAGDDVLCDDRFCVTDEPIYHLAKCVRVENGWIFTDDDETTGKNSNFTFKVVSIIKKQKLIDDIKYLIDTNETQIINLDALLNKSKNSGSASDIEKFARIKAIIATKREFCDNLNKILNNAT